jgi:hypothetical protein
MSNRFFRLHAAVMIALAFLALGSCGRLPESSFALASESRLPKWFNLSPNLERTNVTVTMDYQINSSGRTATFTMRDGSGAVVSKVIGNLTGSIPLQRKAKLSGHPEGYPEYEIVTAGGITEIIEHRKLEPVFYVTDDAAVMAEFSSPR